MPKRWTEKEERYLQKVIPDYRKSILKKNLKEAKSTTLKLAKEIHQDNPVIQNRTVNAIYERLPYLENLLAGVFEKRHYASKDQRLYNTLPRESKCITPNLCNTRHPYNGAMKEYLKRTKRDT
ncbi:hypothetical protein J7I93_13715 [Bacillus sp. ISL-47]|uniref:hypothetical protein n=1 Tax=Bacillus sp. ISL-47 TaxID=2819130 RepID=UPI001BE89D1F|nr:hypothetical protein [Bacillus sp. ISL-47]MBT2689244.1 hypothetical protein [Bacillus sp. ISL-47]MBT2708631.1 hypothetical protein [Pseudomonas sp. ISL-84]